MKTLAELPRPYSEIPTYGNHPKLESDNLNRDLARLLEARHFISSIKEEKRHIKINTFKSSDHS